MPTQFASGSAWNTASNWGLTSGASDGAVPTASDPVIFDGNSVSMAIDVAAACLSLDSTGYTATLTQNNTFTLTLDGLFSDPGELILGLVVVFALARGSTFLLLRLRPGPRTGEAERSEGSPPLPDGTQPPG